jgi:hypothetical protein
MKSLNFNFKKKFLTHNLRRSFAEYYKGNPNTSYGQRNQTFDDLNFAILLSGSGVWDGR